MHQSPNSSEKILFLRQDRLKIYFFGLLSTLFILIGQVFFIITFPYFIPYIVVTGITVFYLMLSYIIGFMGKEFNYDEHKKILGKWFDRAVDASVDVYLPICREPHDLILNTWNHILALVANHPNVKVFVLDDGKDIQMENYAKDYGFNYITRETNELKKAGNLRNAFKQTSGEYILILDADFCPSKEFLVETLPYFFENDNLSILQTPQFFDVQSVYGWIRNGAGAVQELFYRLMQVNRDTFGGAICVGTCAVYRRKHLEPFGGTAPIPYSEDVHTGFQLISNGHDLKYIPVNLALGACPDTAKQFFTQQYRWALGSISLMCSKKFWSANITFMQRICYMTGMFYYVSTGLGAVTYFLPSLFVIGFYPEHMHWYNLLFSIPSLLYSTIFMRYWMKLPYGFPVLRVRAISYYAHLYALRDRLLDTLEEWKPTGAQFNSNRYRDGARLFKVIAYGIPALTFYFIGYRIAQGYPPENFALLSFMTLFNALVMMPVVADLKD